MALPWMAVLVLAATNGRASTAFSTTPSASSGVSAPPQVDDDGQSYLVLPTRHFKLCNGLRCKEGGAGPRPACGVWDGDNYFLFDSLCDLEYFSCMTEWDVVVAGLGECGYNTSTTETASTTLVFTTSFMTTTPVPETTTLKSTSQEPTTVAEETTRPQILTEPTRPGTTGVPLTTPWVGESTTKPMTTASPTWRPSWSHTPETDPPPVQYEYYYDEDAQFPVILTVPTWPTAIVTKPSFATV